MTALIACNHIYFWFIVIICITAEDVDRVIETCISRMSEHAVVFEPAKACILARNLGIGLRGNNVKSYKEVCKLWLHNKGDQCNLGQLVCGLFRSRLARLSCGLRPICKL